MDLPLNANAPHIMHVDLNSCFATLTQQAYISLRHKPLGIAAYDTPNGCVVSPSIEAKRYGVKTGMTVREARLRCPTIVIRTPDPPLYRDAHIRFRRVFKDFSPDVSPKSIDEAVLDFGNMGGVDDLPAIGREIKVRLRREIGEYVTCNIGISTNRFLAKLAASLHKPDGLDVIDHSNLRAVYGRVSLLDLNGIHLRNQARLNASGIFSPLEMLAASRAVLEHQVFQSIHGLLWYRRLRGWEVDAIEFQRRSFGHSYALRSPTAEPQELARLTMKLCEKMGRRLRKAGHAARGIHAAVIYTDWTHWHMGRQVTTEMYTTQELFKKALWVLSHQPHKKVVAKLAVSCYDLVPSTRSQPMLFETVDERARRLQDTIDALAERYGEFVIVPALMMNMENEIIDRISFGGVKDLEDLYGTGA